MKVCKNCGEINPGDSLYCCNCGKDGFIYQEEVICPHCGAVNDKSFTHCINCGNILSVPQTAPTGEQFQPVPVVLHPEVATSMSTAVTLPAETAQCPDCGAIVPITAVFCNKCGTSVAYLHEHRVVQRKICPHCGRLNSLDSHLCSYCYTSLADADTQDMQVTYGLHNLGELTVRQAYLEDVAGKKRVCPNCGTLNAEDEVFCVSCGLKLEAEEPKRYCPNCGEENPSDSHFCSKCRWSFDGAMPDQIEKWTCKKCQHVNDKEDSFCAHCGQKRDM